MDSNLTIDPFTLIDHCATIFSEIHTTKITNGFQRCYYGFSAYLL